MKKSHFATFDEFALNKRMTSSTPVHHMYLDHDYIRIQNELKHYERYLKMRRQRSQPELHIPEPIVKKSWFRSFFSCLFSDSN